MDQGINNSFIQISIQMFLGGSPCIKRPLALALYYALLTRFNEKKTLRNFPPHGAASGYHLFLVRPEGAVPEAGVLQNCLPGKFQQNTQPEEADIPSLKLT